MTISTINRIKTVANKLKVGDGSIITIYENTGLTIGNELIVAHEIISFNCFIKNLRAFALINSLAEISLPNFTLDDSETDKLYKTLNTEWNSTRKQITLYISNQLITKFYTLDHLITVNISHINNTFNFLPLNQSSLQSPNVHRTIQRR